MVDALRAELHSRESDADERYLTFRVIRLELLVLFRADENVRDIVLKPNILRAQVHNLAEPRAGFDQKVDDDAQL